MTTTRNLKLLAIAAVSLFFSLSVSAQESPSLTTRPNLAVVATPTSSVRFGQPLSALNDGVAPTNTGNFRGGNGGNRQQQPRTNLWLQYEWKQPVGINEMAIYWWNYNNGIRLPEAYRIEYWDGSNFVPVKNVSGLGLTNN